MSRRQSAVAVFQSRYTCCTYVASSVCQVHLHICSTYIGQNWGRQASDTISLPACGSYRCPRRLQLDWRWRLSAMADRPTTVCTTLCVDYQYVSQYVHVRVMWRVCPTVHLYVACTHKKSLPCLRGSECNAFCQVCNLRNKHMCMCALQQMQRRRWKHADKSKAGKAEPKHSAQKWRIEAFYCLTRRNMLFQATGQRDAAFWANVLGQLQIYPHTILFLWQFEYSML